MANTVAEIYCQPAKSIEIPSNANCPITNSVCDGGGSRNQTALKPDNLPNHLKEHEAFLRETFPGMDKIQCAICSIKLGDTKKWNKSPWIVCPRRILDFPPSNSQMPIVNRLIGSLNPSAKEKIRVWKEVGVKQKNKSGNVFDYRFDFVMSKVQKNGTPTGPPLIIEVMTSSTSGSNARKGTDIPSSFVKSLLGKTATPPGINYRQVWARMASQLIAKSDIAAQWGGNTVWVLQDNLVNYISNTTGLDLNEMKTTELGDVNLLVSGIPDGNYSPTDLKEPMLISGPIHSENGTMSDLLRVGYVPTLETLHLALTKKDHVWQYE